MTLKASTSSTSYCLLTPEDVCSFKLEEEIRLAVALHVHPVHGPSPSLEVEASALNDTQAPDVTGSQNTTQLDIAV